MIQPESQAWHDLFEGHDKMDALSQRFTAARDAMASNLRLLLTLEQKKARCDAALRVAAMLGRMGGVCVG